MSHSDNLHIELEASCITGKPVKPYAYATRVGLYRLAWDQPITSGHFPKSSRRRYQ